MQDSRMNWATRKLGIWACSPRTNWQCLAEYDHVIADNNAEFESLKSQLVAKSGIVELSVSAPNSRESLRQVVEERGLVVSQGIRSVGVSPFCGFLTGKNLTYSSMTGYLNWT